MAEMLRNRDMVNKSVELQPDNEMFRALLRGIEKWIRDHSSSDDN